MLDFKNLPKGNGKTVYIDLNLLGIDLSLLCCENYTIRVKINPNSNHALLYQAYNDAFTMLDELGYKIIIDSSEIDENTFFFTPCVENWQDIIPEEYHKKLDRKILFSLLKHGINKPVTLPFNVLSQDCISLLPFVIKNEETHGGSEKYLISTDLQFAILKQFLKDTGLEYFFNKNMVIQEYIETPTEYNTSLRVLVSSGGDILCSSLKYAIPEKIGIESNFGILGYHLLNPNSPYFLGGKTFVSNTLAGGHNILLGESSYSGLERQILIAHAIDPDECLVPESIRLACQEVMRNCNKELGAICGIDFIYDAKNKEWKYLEEHEYPMLHSYAMKYQLPYTPTEFRSDGDIILDLTARMHSLSILMKQRKADTALKHLEQ